MSDPLLHFGLGMLGGNVGRSGGGAFANAMQGGLMGLNQASQMQRQMMATNLAHQQFEAEEAQRALEAQRAQERQQAGLGLLGQQGLSPEQEAYYSTFEDPYAQFQASRPGPVEPIKVGRDLVDPRTMETLYRAPAAGPQVQITQGGMKPSERADAALDLFKAGVATTYDEALAIVDQQSGTPAAPVSQAVAQNAAMEAAGTKAPSPRKMTQQQIQTRKNLTEADASGITGMERADRSYQQSSGILGDIDTALSLLPNVKTGVLWGSDFGQAAQSATSPQASDFFNILNKLATMEKVDMIGATGAKAFDSEKEAQQLMRGLISGSLKPEVIRKRLNALKKKFRSNLSRYDAVKQFATKKAGVDWIGDVQQQQQEPESRVINWSDM